MNTYVGRQLGNHRLVRLLGQGGFADVYLGQHVYLNSYAAVKILHTTLTEKRIQIFLSEAQTLAKFTHPHIVRIIDFAVDDNSIPFLVMDYLPNGTLRQRHPRGRRVPLETVVNYLNPVAAALQYAHNNRVIHRDIKPDNMLLGSRNEVILTDFGIAAIAHGTQSMSMQDEAGTVFYMSPDQIQGKARPASDQYSLAVVVYEWLLGSPPFTGNNVFELYTKHISAAPRSLREQGVDIPEAAEQALMKALEKDWQNRHASVKDFAIAFHRGVVGDTKSFVPSPLLTSRALSQTDASTGDVAVDYGLLETDDMAPTTVPFFPSIFTRQGRKKLSTLSKTIAALVLLALIALAIFTPTLIKAATHAFHLGARPTGDMPMYGLDAQHTNFNSNERQLSAENVGGLAPDWTATIDGQKILAAPIVVGKNIYLGAWDGRLYVFAKDGCGETKICTPLWMSQPTGGHIEGTAAVDGGVVYVSSWDKKLYAFSADGCGAAECPPLWVSEATGARIDSSPVVASGVVYVGSEDRRLYAFKAGKSCATTPCQALWRSEETGAGLHSSPAVAEGVVYIGSQDHRLYAYNASGCGKATCKPLWKSQETGARIDSSPAIANGVVYIGSQDHRLYAYNASGCGDNKAECEPKWSSEPTRDIITSSPSVAEDIVYIISQDRHLYAYDAGGCWSHVCQPRWISSTPMGKITASPVIANGVVYVGAEDHRLYAYDTGGCGRPSCEALINLSIGVGPIDTAVAVVNGVIYVSAIDGNLYALRVAN